MQCSFSDANGEELQSMSDSQPEATIEQKSDMVEFLSSRMEPKMQNLLDGKIVIPKSSNSSLLNIN